MITLDDAEELIKIARDSILSVYEDKRQEITPDIKKRFSKLKGAFVTLTIDDQLRGCIGFTQPVQPLYSTIIGAAKSAAFRDPRFPELSREEYDSVKVEISVLTVPKYMQVSKPEEYLDQIKIGEDGLIIKGSYTSGLLLPQVFSEHKCTPKSALEWTCEKAGLPKNAWKDLNNKIYKFQAQIFKEENGKVVEHKP